MNSTDTERLRRLAAAGDADAKQRLNQIRRRRDTLRLPRLALDPGLEPGIYVGTEFPGPEYVGYRFGDGHDEYHGDGHDEYHGDGHGRGYVYGGFGDGYSNGDGYGYGASNGIYGSGNGYGGGYGYGYGHGYSGSGGSGDGYYTGALYSYGYGNGSGNGSGRVERWRGAGVA